MSGAGPARTGPVEAPRVVETVSTWGAFEEAADQLNRRLDRVRASLDDVRRPGPAEKNPPRIQELIRSVEAQDEALAGLRAAIAARDAAKATESRAALLEQLPALETKSEETARAMGAMLPLADATYRARDRVQELRRLYEASASRVAPRRDYLEQEDARFEGLTRSAEEKLERALEVVGELKITEARQLQAEGLSDLRRAEELYEQVNRKVDEVLRDSLLRIQRAREEGGQGR